jgi:hypothetical protein
MMLESCCIYGELRHTFEIGETDLEWVIYVKSKTLSISEMKDKLLTVLMGHYGLSFTVLKTKEHASGNVLLIQIVA